MSIITSLTRMWLTRSTKPFIFKNEYDNVCLTRTATIWACMCISLFAGASATSVRTARSDIPRICATDT